MKILVLSGSPKKETSVTLNTIKYIEKISEFSTKDEFTEVLIGNGKYNDEIGEKIKESDLVIFCSSLFHFNVHQQYMAFFDAMEKNIGNILKGKAVTYFTTSSQLMDQEAHYYTKRRLRKMGANFIRGLSIRDYGMLSGAGREEIANWYHYVRSYVKNQDEKFKDSDSKIVFLDVTNGNNQKINDSVKKAKEYFESFGAENIVEIHLKDYKINPCTECTCCFAKGECYIEDDFSSLTEKIYKDTDIIVTFGEQENGLLGTTHKVWIDRHVKFGKHPMENEIISAYVVDSSKSAGDEKFAMNIYEKAFNNFNKNYYLGICDTGDNSNLQAFCQDAVRAYNYEMYPQSNFYSQGTFLVCKSLAWDIQKMNPGDYEYFARDKGYEKPEINKHIQKFYSYKEAIESQKNRLTPYRMIIAGTHEDCSLKTKRRENNMWNKSEKISLQEFDKKQGFFARLLEKIRKIFKK